MFMTRTRRVLAAAALIAASTGGLLAGTQSAQAAPKPPPPAHGGYSLAGIQVWLYCDDGSPQHPSLGYNYLATTDANGHFTFAEGQVDQHADVTPPILTFYPRQIIDQTFNVLAPDPDMIMPSAEIYREDLPDATIASGKIPKGKTKVTCGFISPGDLLNEQFFGQDDPPRTETFGTVYGFTAVS
jgi:hypothetical protein